MKLSHLIASLEALNKRTNGELNLHEFPNRTIDPVSSMKFTECESLDPQGIPTGQLVPILGDIQYTQVHILVTVTTNKKS